VTIAVGAQPHELLAAHRKREIMPFEFLLAALATWRLTFLLTGESGPYDLIARVRARAGDRVLGRGLQCFYCTSLWIAAPLALFVTTSVPRVVVVWLGLSGAACLLDRVSSRAFDALPLDELQPHGGP
jgi:hypothetical protein